MNGRLAKVVAMFNALSDSDKEAVLTEIDYPEPPGEPDPGFPPPPAEPLEDVRYPPPIDRVGDSV